MESNTHASKQRYIPCKPSGGKNGKILFAWQKNCLSKCSGQFDVVSRRQMVNLSRWFIPNKTQHHTNAHKKQYKGQPITHNATCHVHEFWREHPPLCVWGRVKVANTTSHSQVTAVLTRGRMYVPVLIRISAALTLSSSPGNALSTRPTANTHEASSCRQKVQDLLHKHYEHPFSASGVPSTLIGIPGANVSRRAGS